MVHGDATDLSFWQRIDAGRIRLVMLAMPDHRANLTAASLLTESGYTGHIAAVAGFVDEVTQLQEAGVHAVINAYRKAGTWFADDVCAQLGDLTR